MAIDPTRKDWSLMVKTRNGTVSLLRDLTLAEVRSAYERLDPFYGDFYGPIQHMPGGGWIRKGPTRLAEPGDVVQREVIGPAGWDRAEIETWDRWPKDLPGETSGLSFANGETILYDSGWQRCE